MTGARHILIVGAGSAGQRHARNLGALGCRISAFDPRADRLEEIGRQLALIGRYTALEEALASGEFDGYVIASPPAFHVPQVLQVLDRRSGWVLCEKPLSLSAPESSKLRRHAERILLGYTYRWWPPIRRLRQRMLSGEVGAIRNVRFVMSAHLQDWHPWEKYQEFFMSRREMGGGALLDESHFIDLMLWFLGAPASLYAQVDKISDLEIDSDDNVDILAAYPNGTRVNLHLDLIGRPHDRSITIVGEQGTLVYSYEENAVKVGHEGARKWEVESFDCERNEMFVGAARELLALMSGEVKQVSCSVQDGIRTLELVDACRESALTGKSVAIAP